MEALFDSCVQFLIPYLECNQLWSLHLWFLKWSEGSRVVPLLVVQTRTVRVSAHWPPLLCPTGLPAASQGGKQAMEKGNHSSGEVLQPLCVCGEAALCWQSHARAAATAELTPGVFRTPHLKCLGSMVFMVHGPANSAGSISRWAGTMLEEKGGVSEA